MQRYWNSAVGWMSPSKRRRTQDPPAPPKRLELPRIKLPGKQKAQKDKLNRALESARVLKESGFAKPSIEKDFCAASSLGSKNAKKKTINKILDALTHPDPPLPLNADLLKGLASALSDGGYKAGEGYLVEAKLWHVEEGHPWSDQLDRVFKQCKRALTRGQGPRKKAKEVSKEERLKPKKLSFQKADKAVKFGKELFDFCVVWMLREIELAALNTEDLVTDHISKRVCLNLKLSKMDAEGKGIRRTLQCLCTSNNCGSECPYWISVNLVNLVERFNGTGSPLALVKNRELATKAQVIKTWRWLYGPEVSGHSGRRTGAPNYIRSGWAITQVAHLGRWKSNAILGYAEEALEQMPTNLHLPVPTVDKAGVLGLESKAITEEDFVQWKAQLKKEMESLRENMQKSEENQSEQMDYWAKLYKENPGSMPRKIQNKISSITAVDVENSLRVELLRQQLRLHRPGDGGQLPEVPRALREDAVR